MRFDRNIHLPLLAMIVAVWPVWNWLASRALDDGQDAVPLLSFATALVLLWCNRDAPALRAAQGEGKPLLSWTFPLSLILLYAATYRFLPPLGRALIAMSALAAACSTTVFRKRMDLRLAGLMMLSLPVVPTLNFYIGYPLRAGAAELTSMLLRLNGLSVSRAGASLAWGAEQVAVDAPCSGVKMLWSGMFLSFAIAAMFDLNSARTVSLAAVGMIMVLAANVMRATALFYVETGLLPRVPFAHEFIGLAVFGLGAAGVACAAFKMRTIPHAR